MIRTVLLSVSCIGLAVSGGLILSEANSHAMQFSPHAGDVAVTTYKDAPGIADDDSEMVLTVRAPLSQDAAPVITNAALLVVEDPVAPDAPLADDGVPRLYIMGTDAPLVSLRPLQRPASVMANAPKTVTPEVTPAPKAKPRRQIARAVAPPLPRNTVATLSTRGKHIPFVVTRGEPVVALRNDIATPSYLVGVYR